MPSESVARTHGTRQEGSGGDREGVRTLAASGHAAPRRSVSLIPSGARVFVHGAAATPTPLLEALVRATRSRRRRALPPAHRRPGAVRRAGARGRFLSISLFTGAPLRRADRRGRAPTSSRSSSRTSRALFPTGRIPLDVALVQLSPPDRHGYCTLGTSVDAALAAARCRRGSSSPRSTSGCRARTATRSCRSIARRRVHAHRPAAARAPARAPPTEVEDAHRRARGRAGRRRRHAADGHRRHPRRRAAAAGRQARPRRPHRDVLGRRSSIWSRAA